MHAELDRVLDAVNRTFAVWRAGHDECDHRTDRQRLRPPCAVNSAFGRGEGLTKGDIVSWRVPPPPPEARSTR